jgi:hypothetical protein
VSCNQIFFVLRQNFILCDKFLYCATKFYIVRQDFILCDKILYCATKFYIVQQNFILCDPICVVRPKLKPFSFCRITKFCDFCKRTLNRHRSLDKKLRLIDFHRQKSLNGKKCAPLETQKMQHRLRQNRQIFALGFAKGL